MYLGAHLGIAEGFDRAVLEAKRIGCEALQIFAKSPQQWKGPPISPEAAEGFRRAVREVGLRATAVHHGYLLNLGHPDEARLRQSIITFRDEVERAELLGVDSLIFHPGAHLHSGSSAAIERIATSLNAVLAGTPGFRVRVLIENSAGQGTTIGSTFEELASLLDRVEEKARVGVCLDTCHLFQAGFDFRTPEGYGEVIDRLDRIVGVRSVRAFHLNDSKAPFGSHRDRHENIGRGTIGLEGFRSLVHDPRWERVPGFLETPLDAHSYGRYEADLESLRRLRGAPDGATKKHPPSGGARRAARPKVK